MASSSSSANQIVPGTRPTASTIKQAQVLSDIRAILQKIKSLTDTVNNLMQKLGG